ncbi:MAG TPA: HEAT repeat domain-containing protein [Planococcus sp. (in: firmicutes)]|nr:HEAT repeat domain-containing protein [Planococcus sp. (in: firmicutes)]
MNIYAFWILNAILFLGQLILLLFLAWRKQKLTAKERTITEQYDALTDVFSSYMMDPSDERFIQEIHSASHKGVVLERLLNGYVSVTKGSVTSPLVAKLSEDFLTARYAKQLMRKSWAIRMNTLYFIEDFHMQSLTPLLKEKLRKTVRLDQETQQLIRTLASLNEPITISVLAQYPDAPVRLYIDVFKRLEEHSSLEELNAALSEETNNKALKHAAISYIGMAGLIAFLPRIEKELQTQDVEIRIQALKSIFHLQYISDPILLTPFFQSLSWQERMFASQIAGRLQLSRFKEVLSELLGDSVWWVRYSSAEALTQFSDGDILLTHLSAYHPDRFARDMATQWKSSLLGSEK